jgi:hypothetical protein
MQGGISGAPKLKWKREDDGSYTSEAGRISKGRFSEWEWSRDGVYKGSEDRLSDIKLRAEKEHHLQFLRLHPPKPRELMTLAIADAERERSISVACGGRDSRSLLLAALRHCQETFAFSTELVEALDDWWKERVAR